MNSIKPKYAIIVAGGSGTRMQSQIPKQYLLLDGKPILYHTIKKFLSIANLEIILVLPKIEIENWNIIINKCLSQIEIDELKLRTQIVFGGDSRFQSVKNGLNSIPNKEGVVAIHDGVRPLINTKKIQETFDLIANYPAVILAVNVKDSVRQVESDSKNKIIDRSILRLVQTPQTFDLQILKKAYDTAELNIFTDDASVVEYAGGQIHIHEGEYTNLKITTPEDLIVAEILLKNPII